MKLKICGMQPGDDLAFTAHPAVSYIGLIFVPASKRYVRPEDARAWLNRSQPRCPVIGVFVNESVDHIRDVAAQVGLGGVQLHGNETPAACERLKSEGLTTWKSLQVANDTLPEQLLETASSYTDHVDGLLLDAAPPKGVQPNVTGGHGITFDWSILSMFLTSYRKLQLAPEIWVAGGFQPGNVSRFSDVCGLTARPTGIDVSSGVEHKGRKSIQQINQMIQVVSTLD